MKEEMKKALYKEKVTAYFEAAGSTFFQYNAETSLGKVVFRIPTVEAVEDIINGEPIKASLLIRWML